MFKNSKIFFIIFYLILIFILLFILYKNFSITEEFAKVEKINSQIKKKAEVDKMSKKDSDGDGLADWEEILYNTDPELADTDGDGISDFIEIRNSTDPLIAGRGKVEKIKELNLTTQEIDILAEQQERFKNILQQNKEREEKLKKLATKINKSPQDLEFLQKDQELKKVEKESLNQAGIILNKNLIPGNDRDDRLLNNLFLYFIPNDEKVWDEIVASNELDKKYIKKQKYQEISDDEIMRLKLIIKSFKQSAEELKTQEINSLELKYLINDLARAYNDLGNNIEKLLFGLQEKKPTEYFKYISRYNFSLGRMVKAYGNINKFIVLRGINFAENEAGKIFVYSL